MQAETFYHIYNRANGNEQLFYSAENYRYFLQQFKKYIVPVADIYAYCLLVNHFHFVLKIKSESAVRGQYNIKDGQSFGKFKTFQKMISKQFSNLFSSYTQAFNKMYGRTGSLFSPNFKRKELTSDNYLRNLIIYINTNPNHHGVADYSNYRFSSYKDVVEGHDSFLKQAEIISLFEDIENFKYVHRLKKINIGLINQLIFE